MQAVVLDGGSSHFRLGTTRSETHGLRALRASLAIAVWLLE